MTEPKRESLKQQLFYAALEINSGAALFLASILLSNNISLFGPMMIIGTIMWIVGVIRISMSIGGLIVIFIFGEKP
jgi:hypothetical protein